MFVEISIMEKRTELHKQDKSDNVLFGLLSFCIPIVGIILAIVWWNQRHNIAKTCLIYSLVSMGLALILELGVI